MSISFSGLASGLDTSSWVESLTALREAKVETYEEEKTSVESLQETLSNIKSFFSSFRSMIEKVTDASFGIPTMDIFAQKLATSTDTSVLTAAATTEAEEGTYDVFVDKLATETQAISGLNTTKTIVESQTATLDSSLKSIGVRAGEIGVTVNDTKHVLELAEDDTIQDLIKKLRNIGVSANYNETSGIFSVNLDSDDIDDTLTVQDDGTVGTGIVEALNLSETGGYESGDLEVSTVDTIVATATGETKLSTLGVKAGTVKIEANGVEYSFQITNNSTIEEFVDAMQGEGIEASFENGVLSITDAEITNDGTTNLISALGLKTSVNHNTQTSNGLNYTEIRTAQLYDKITDFVPDGKGEISIFDETGVKVGSVTVTDSTTFESLFDRLSDFGIKGRLEDGVVSISSTSGNYVSGGLMDKLGVGVVTTTITTTSGAGISSGSAVDYDTVTEETTTIYTTTTQTHTSTSTIGTGVSSGNAVDYDTVTEETTTIYTTTTQTHTSTSTIGTGVSSGNAVDYDTVTEETTTIYTTTTQTHTSTSTIGTGVSSGNAVDYDTVTEETTTIYTTTTQTHTSTSTVGTGISSGSAVDYDTVVSELTTVYSTTTLTTTSTTAVDTTSSGVLTYSTVVTTSTTETIAVDMTSSSGVYYTKVVTTTSPGSGEESGGTEGYSSMQSSSAVYVTNKTSTSLGSDRVINPEITVTDAAFLNAALANYTTIGIGSADALAQLATVVNNGNTLEGKTLVLTNDIDLSGYSSWTSIGNASNKTFNGTFDGQGHVIKNLKNSLFGYTEGAEIRNVGIENCDISIDTSTSSQSSAGGLIGIANNTKINNSYVTGNIKANGLYNSYLGGLIGVATRVEISNSYYSGTISSTTSNSAESVSGGLIGDSTTSKINNSYVNANITTSSTSTYKAYVSSGGLIGEGSSSDVISNSYVTGTISANISGNAGSEGYAGGLVGYGSYGVGTISYSYTSAYVTANSTDNRKTYAGGLVGKSGDFAHSTTTDIRSSFALGESKGKYSGGILGEDYNSKGTYLGVYYNSSKNTGAINSGGHAGIVGISESQFTVSNLQVIGFTDANGWMYTGSSALPELKVQNQLNSATTLKELLGDGCSAQTVVVQTSSGIQNIVISANDSILKKLTDAGLQVSAENGKLVINGGGNATILSVSSALSAALKLVGNDASSEPQSTTKPVELTSSEALTYRGYDSGGNLTNYELSFNEECDPYYQVTTDLGDFGVVSTNYITVQNGSTTTTIAVNSNTYFSEGFYYDSGGFYCSIKAEGILVQMLEDVGIKTYVTNGKVTFVGDDTHYILGMTAGLRVALNMDSGVGYTVIPNQTTGGDSGGSGSSGGSSTYISTIYISSSASNVALSSVGVNSTNYITVKNGSTTSIVTVDASTTVNQLSSALAGVGITTDVTNGKFTFSGDSTHYILGITTNLKSALNLMESGGQGYTVRTVETSSTQTVTLASANTDIQLGALGVTGSNFITVQNGTTTRTISVDSNTSLSDMVSLLANAGIAASVSGGKLTLSGDDSHYILGITDNLESALKLTAGSGKTYTTSTIKTTVTTPVETTVNVTQNVLMSEETLFSQLGMTSNSETIVGVQNGRTFTMTVTSSDTVGDIANELEDYGFNTSVRGGKLYIDGSENAYLTGISSNLKKALGITSNIGAGTTYTVTTQKTETTTTTVSEKTEYTTSSVLMSEETLFSQLGMTSNSETIVGVQNGRTFTMTVTSSDTVGDIAEVLQDYGFNVSIRGGKIYIDGNENAYLKSISSNLKNALGITVNPGAGTTYTVTTQKTETTTTTSSEKTEYTTNTVLMSEETLFSQLGMTSNSETIVGVYNGRTFTMTVTSSDTVGDIAEVLQDYGFNVSIRGGKIYIDGNENAYLKSISSNLKNALGITVNPGAGTTYTVTTQKTETTTTTVSEKTEYTTSSVLMSEETLFSQLGMTSNSETIVGVQNGRTFTMTVTSSDTVGDIAEVLQDYGFNTSVRGGKIYIDGNENAYIKSISSNLKKALGITVNPGAGTTYTVTTEKTETTTTIANEQTNYITTSVQMSEDTKLSQLGMSGNQTITGVQNGKAFTISVTASDTVGDILGALGDYGLTASVRGGKIYINQSDDAYITNMSSGIKSALNITSTIGNNGSYTITTIKTYENTAATNGVLGTVTAVSAVTRDTLLSELGVTSGEFNIRVNGVKYTALISSDETVGDFLDTLETFGLQTSIINNGNSSVIRITGNGDAYIQKSSSVNGASNVVDVLFPAANSEKTYNYEELLQTYTTVTSFTTATEDTLLTEFDTAWGGTTLKTAGNLVITTPDGDVSTIRIRETDTIGSLIDKLETAGIAASFNNGKLYIYGGASIVAAGTTSSLGNPNAGLELNLKNNLVGMMFSTDKVEETTTIIEEHSFSAASYADLNTKLGTLNITGGTLSVYRNGQKILLNIEADDTFSDLRAMLASKYSDLDLKFEEGHLIFYSKDDDVSVEVGNTTDTSNFLAVTGLIKEDNQAKSARALYTVNSDSLVTADGIFRAGKVTTGSFTIGTAVININSNTTIADIVSQINNNEDTNATAYWDSIDGKLVIEARTSGAALINIEAGTSNFTDIMGFTSSEWNPDGTIKSTRMNIETQTLGSNAQFRINGTTYTASSNTVTSDITRLKGVTLNLNGLTAGSAVKVTVENDKESVATALSDIVDSYNELMKNVDEAIANDGALHNQTTLKMIRNQLRSLMTSSDRGATIFRNLDAIGISVDAASASNISTSNSSIISLTFDKEKFFDAYEAEHDAVKDLLIGGVDNKGIFTQVETLLENSLQAVSGYFAITEKSFQRQINNLNEKISKENTAIEKYRARLEKKFSSMDILIGQMQQQYSSFLGF